MGNKLPKPTAVELLKERQADIDGAFGVSQAEVPDEAEDIGDVDNDANPHATDLDYNDPSSASMEEKKEGSMHTFYDGVNIRLAGETYVCANDGSVIDDVTNWA